MGLNLAPVVTSTVKEELIASNRSAGPLAPFDLSSPVLSSNGILTDRATGMHCCEFCGYMSSNRGNVTYHIRSKHTGERPFGCPFCDYRSSRKTTLRLHMNRHRPFSDVRNCRSPSSGGRSSTPSAAPSISPVSAISPGPAPATSQASSVSKISTVSPVSPISSMSSVTPRTALTAGIPYGAMELIMGTNIDLISGQTR
ncbi:transcription factor hamlet-like [Varroa jacobsoni]|uniref:C2H2-type domain-containing protein n=1 Tax=Varroa destructor TaxID=109461 RepID=A0A7M7J7I7_VARDE|nr:transcription factor hamlet-like [Varroa destructor]XP_022711810.1 transcription factor hamlet-like [Varroa jacobsoni]